MFYTKTKDTSIRLTKYINKKKQEKLQYIGIMKKQHLH